MKRLHQNKDLNNCIDKNEFQEALKKLGDENFSLIEWEIAEKAIASYQNKAKKALMSRKLFLKK